ncbi:hypothetical protein [Nocardioides limicola]|uniref:hypothetical protein n=1 Tax=Nocardioides limicola TaxID=2803368 RepID=UPI00193BAE51|nr:hypothetical protein [Nocardioides sp. DJM-14]
MIDTEVDGSPASVNAAATWLRSTLKANVDEAADLQAGARAAASAGWDGAGAQAYRDFMAPVVTASDNHVQRIGRAATALDVYASRLGRMQTDMDALRQRAQAGGLILTSTTIEPPPLVPASVVIPGSAEDLARQQAIAKVTLFNELAEEAVALWAGFYEWIDAQLAVDLSDAREKDRIDKILAEVAGVLPNFAAGTGAGLAGLALTRMSERYRNEAREFRRRSRVSGNPQVRGQADRPSGRTRLDDWAGKARRFGRWGRILGGPVGVGIEIGFGIHEGATTGDWKRAAITTGASLAAAAGITALVAAGVVSAPALAVVVGGGLVVAGVGWGAGKIYDNWDGITDWASNTWGSAKSALGKLKPW